MIAVDWTSSLLLLPSDSFDQGSSHRSQSNLYQEFITSRDLPFTRSLCPDRESVTEHRRLWPTLHKASLRLVFSSTYATMPAATRSLESMVLQAHRAKGVRYPTSTQKDCFKTWYSYALRKGEVEKTSAKVIQEHGRHLRAIREAAPGGRTYL